jgi:2-(1,2-epoxy-1,2-dihydrophenyl)acetyl-CoA isomerase
VPGLRSERTAGVLRLTLDRADRRNAADDAMMFGLVAALESVATDDTVRAVVLTGAGDHFCSGADIVARNAGGGEKPAVGSIQRRLPTQAHRLIPLVLELQKPVVAVVRGWAAGLGFQLALAADFCVAATDARFWEPFITRGFTPDSGATWLLPRRVGEVRARELLMLGRELSGAEAAEWGLVHRAVAPGDLEAEADALVGALAAGPTVALGLTKHLLNHGREATLADQLASEAFAMELSSRAEDFREGLAAFREKRAPGFKGR